MATPQQPGRAELLPRYLYFSSVLKGRRVLEVGAVAATDGLSAHFLARLALEVTAVDDAADAVNRAQKTLGRPGLDFKEGPLSKLRAKSFDVVFASDISDSATVDELTRLVARKGFLIAAVRDGAGTTLSGRAGGGSSRVAERVIATLSQQFESVAVVWQSAVLGYEISFEETEAPAVDASLAAGVEPAFQLIIASTEPPALPVSTVFRLSHDYVELADKAAYKALEAELHSMRIEMVEKEAHFHSQGGSGAPAAFEDTDKFKAPAAHVKLLATAHEQMKLAVEQLKSTNEKMARMKESLAAEAAARAAVEKELERLRMTSTAERNQLEQQLERAASVKQALEDEQTSVTNAAAVAAVDKQKLQELLEQANNAISRAAAEKQRLEQQLQQAQGNVAKSAAALTAERQKFEQRFAEAEANAGRFGAAVRDQTKKLAESEAALKKATARLGELEEEIALGKTMESNELAAEKLKAEQLQTKVHEVTAREHLLMEQLGSEREQAAITDRNFASIMRELREALDAKEELEKQLANEKLERARMERMRKV